MFLLRSITTGGIDLTPFTLWSLRTNRSKVMKRKVFLCISPFGRRPYWCLSHSLAFSSMALSSGVGYVFLNFFFTSSLLVPFPARKTKQDPHHHAVMLMCWCFSTLLTIKTYLVNWFNQKDHPHENVNFNLTFQQEFRVSLILEDTFGKDLYELKDIILGTFW